MHPGCPSAAALVEHICNLRDSLPEPPMAHTLFDELSAEQERSKDGRKRRAGSAEHGLEAVDIGDLSGFAESDRGLTAAYATEPGKRYRQKSAEADDWLRREIEGAAAALPDSERGSEA